MRVVVRTTTESSSDSTPAGASSADAGPLDASSADGGSTASDSSPSESSTPGGNPAPPIGDGSATATSSADAGTTGTDTAVATDAEGIEDRPTRTPTEQAITCQGYSEGEHGLKLTDADGEKCGYVPYDELLRIVPE
jgi:hypothetical protein